MPARYRLQYLPLFWEDLAQVALYIRNVLNTPDAAARLVDSVEQKILEHLEDPTAASVYKTMRERKLPYYWFAVGDYMVFHAVHDDVTEVCRLAYGARDLTKIIV